jgi:hypothetical protein
VRVTSSNLVVPSKSFIGDVRLLLRELDLHDVGSVPAAHPEVFPGSKLSAKAQAIVDHILNEH